MRRDKGKCVLCGQPGTDVDHIVPAWAIGSDLDDNLQLLCHPCHARKTAQDASNYRKWQARRNQRDDPAPGEAR